MEMLFDGTVQPFNYFTVSDVNNMKPVLVHVHREHEAPQLCRLDQPCKNTLHAPDWTNATHALCAARYQIAPTWRLFWKISYFTQIICQNVFLRTFLDDKMSHAVAETVYI